MGSRRDIKFAVRSLMRNRSLTALAVVTFGLGIAACVAMFSVLNTVLLRPLPFPDPDRVVNVYPTNPDQDASPGTGSSAERGSFSYPELEDIWRADPDVLDGFAMAYPGNSTFRPAGAPPERISVVVSTPDLLGRIMGVNPVLGRVFVDRDRVENPDVALLGEAFWRTRFGSDPNVVGQTIRLGNRAASIVGVVPGGTRFADREPDVWSLLLPWDNRGDHRTHAVARLAEGVTPERAAEVLSAIALANVPENHSRHGVFVVSRQAEVVRDVRMPLTLLAGAAVVLLLIACANVAALLVGRLFDRRGELDVRVALGAARGDLFRQIVTEALALAVAGAALGVILSGLAIRGLELIAPEGLPRIDQVELDLVALLAAVAITLAAGLLTGLVPAFAVRAGRVRASSFRTRGVAAGRSSLQGAVVVAEIAMATVLLVAGGLFVRTVTELGRADPGFAMAELASFFVSLPAPMPDADAEPAPEPARDRLGALARELEALSGVEGVALSSVLPLSTGRNNNTLEFQGYRPENQIIAERRFVSANFFEVTGIELVEGRGFDTRDDRPDAPGTLVLSESLARHVWPDEPAVGKTVSYWGRETRVIGVAADQRDQQLRDFTEWAFYVPRVQAGQLDGGFLVRAARPEAVVPSVRARIRQVEPAAAVIGLQPMADLVSGQIAEEMYRARLAVLFAVLATVCSIMGIYGVTARAVATRTREFGIRKALGARDRTIMQHVLRRAGRLAALGGLAGLIAAYVATRWMDGLLWGVERTDPLTLVGVAATLALGALVAALAPGIRAWRLDAAGALRAE